jgi:hypothetical protein
MSKKAKEGDFYYVRMPDGYYTYKIVRIDRDALAIDHAPFVVHHVVAYQPVSRPPTPADIDSLEVMLWHAPVAPEEENPAGEKRTYFASRPVRDIDLQGYRAYMRRTR